MTVERGFGRRFLDLAAALHERVRAADDRAWAWIDRVTGRTAPLVREAPTNGDESAWLTLSYAAAKEQALRRFEKSYVEALMRACDNNISAAARKAGMDRSNFKRVLRKYRADVEADGPEDHGPRALA